MESHEIISNLFVKYLENRCSAGEIKQLLQYFDSGENEKVLRALIQAGLGFAEDNNENNKKTEAAVKKVKSIILKEIREQNKTTSIKKRLIDFNKNKWLKIAALWFVLLTSSLLLLNKHFKDKYRSGNNRQLLHVYTRPGEKKILELYDGTKIWLSPSSSLEYPDQLIGNLREVKLDGEAFFDVAKDKVHPFIIHAGKMDTKVVGTSFNVQSYKGQLNYTVTVVTGIVRVTGFNTLRKTFNEVILKPNQQSQFNNESGKVISKDYPDAQKFLKRKDGILNYDGTPVQDVAADFSRYYKVPIVFPGKSHNCVCYGEFDTKRPLHILLEQLAAAINAKVIYKKDKFLIEGGCDE